MHVFLVVRSGGLGWMGDLKDGRAIARLAGMHFGCGIRGLGNWRRMGV